MEMQRGRGELDHWGGVCCDGTALKRCGCDGTLGKQ
jgi:hypothetical protein